MGLFVPRHKARVNAMFPSTQLSILSNGDSNPTYTPLPDHLSRFLAYLRSKPHKIKKTTSYLLRRFERAYFKSLDYITLGNTCHLRRLGFVEKKDLVDEHKNDETAEKGPDKQPSLTERLSMLKGGLSRIDTILKPLSPASIFYSILVLVSNFITEDLDEKKVFHNGDEAQKTDFQLHQGIIQKPNKYETAESRYFSRFDSKPSSCLLMMWSRKIYKRSKYHSFFISPNQTELRTAALKVLPVAITIEDWKYLFSFKSMFVKLGYIYFPDNLLISSNEGHSIIINTLFDSIKNSDVSFLSFLRYFMLRLKICAFVPPLENYTDHKLIFPLDPVERIYRTPVADDASESGVDANDSQPLEPSMISPALSLRSSELDSELILERQRFAASAAPFLFIKHILLSIKTFSFPMVTTVIEEIRSGIDKIALVSSKKLGSVCTENCLFEISMVSLLSQILDKTKDISALVPALLKTCIVQLLRLARLEYMCPEKQLLEDSIFVFDGTLFILKSSHIQAKMICSLLSSILCHHSVSLTRQDMYAYFINRLLSTPTTASSSTLSAYGGGHLIPLSQPLVSAFIATTSNSARGMKLGKTLPNVLLRLKLSRERIFNKGGDSSKNRKLGPLAFDGSLNNKTVKG